MILDTQDFQLPLWAICIVLLFCAWIVKNRRVEIIAGIYCSSSYWLYNIMVGPIALTWVWIFTLIVTMVRYRPNEPLIRFEKPLLWLSIWCAWVICVLYILPLPSAHRWNLLSNLLLYIYLPIFPILRFARNTEKVRTFTGTFTVFTVTGGILLFLVSQSTTGWTIQSGLLSSELLGLGRSNYHSFASCFVIAFSFLLAMFFETKSLFKKVLLAVASFFLAYVTVLSGSRQASSGLILTAAILTLWSIRKGASSRLITLCFVIVMAVVGFFLSTYEPLVNKVSLMQSESLGERGPLFLSGFSLFMESPLWGQGFSYYNIAHNFFLESLLTSGLAGFVLLLGFMYCAVNKSIRQQFAGSSRSGTSNTEILRAAFLTAYAYSLFETQFVGGTLHGYFLYWGAIVIWSISQVPQDRAFPSPKTHHNGYEVLGVKSFEKY